MPGTEPWTLEALTNNRSKQVSESEQRHAGDRRNGGESAHTPGPWILATVPTSIGSCHKIGPFPNGDRWTYACVYADGLRVGIDDQLPAAQVIAANARLMAAAPDLLEALKAVALAADLDVDFAETFAATMYVVEEAIAKATGEQPCKRCGNRGWVMVGHGESAGADECPECVGGSAS